MENSLNLLIFHMLVLTGSGVKTYDEYSSSCMRPGGGRTAKAFPEPPCDFKNQGWCTAPGSAYPWHAVRRFVHENQGLMRRMYGDMRQISVLRAEYESNDVLYPGDGTDFQLIRDGVTKRYRPVSIPESTTTRSSSRGTTRGNSTPASSTPTTTSSTSTHKTSPSSSVVTITTTLRTSTASSTTVTPSATSTVSSSSVSTSPANTETAPLITITEQGTTDTEHDGMTEDAMLTTSDPSTVDTTMLLEEREKEIAQVVEDVIDQVTDQMELLGEEQQFGNTEELSEAELEYEEGGDEFIEETAEKHQQIHQQPQMIRRGINACPVKEEVVAPFWANNTRGEILALLNLYPFEQYVHWEKCTDEHQQMFCRDGCRCEQQYRLHRLLAYDPRNECRGIFSDWFKFPSCCVCKCYDIPSEFRLTSRSPRRGQNTSGSKMKKGSNSKNNKVHKTLALQRHEDIFPPVGFSPSSVPINGLERRTDNGAMRADLQAVVHHADPPPRPGRMLPEVATIGPVDAATPHFYYQPPLDGIMQLSRRPRNV